MRIAYTPGVWDVLHCGHINLITKAKMYGDLLVVGVCSDKLAILHGKNPVINEQDRAFIVESIRWVDSVHIYDNPDQTEALKLHKANVFVIGEEFGKQGVPEHKNALLFCEREGINVVRLPRHPGVSSTFLKKKINEMNKEQVIKMFWENRAESAKNKDLGMFQSTSLTPTEEAALERKNIDLAAILQALAKTTQPKKMLLDLGCGVGRITVELAKHYEQVHAVDYVQSFIDIAKEQPVNNVHWQCAEAHLFDKQPFDCCTISGLLICLSDESVDKVLDAISYIPAVVLKESVGTYCRFELAENHYSNDLQANYTATYRTPNEIIGSFMKRGYKLSYSEKVEQHRKETNLQVFLFEK